MWSRSGSTCGGGGVSSRNKRSHSRGASAASAALAGGPSRTGCHLATATETSASPARSTPCIQRAESLGIRGRVEGRVPGVCGRCSLGHGFAESIRVSGPATRGDRWTANAMTVSDPTVCSGAPPLEFMSCVLGRGVRVQPRMWGFIPSWAPWLTATTSNSGSYKQDDVLAYVERVLAPRPMENPWRLLLVDAYAAQTTDVGRRLAW